MPTTYSHHRFGRECIQVLPAHFQKLVQAQIQVFDFGVQGPDLFFYNNFFYPPPLINFGRKLHRSPGRVSFRFGRKAIQANPADREGLLAYSLAFLSHFVLDGTCHSYVDRKAEVNSISHNYVEAQYDAHLIRKDGGGDPRFFDRSQLQVPDREAARVIGLYFDLPPGKVYSCMVWDQRILSGFAEKRKGLRRFFKFLSRLGGPGPAFYDLFLKKEEDLACKDSNMRLDKLKDLALDRFAQLVPPLLAYLLEGAPLPPAFNQHFLAKEGYQKIPVLSPEEEKNFLV